MAWIISKRMWERLESSRSAQGQGADCSDQKSSGSEPSVPLRLNPTVLGFYVSDKMTDHCLYSQFGIMFAPLTENLGRELLTLSQQDSHARTSLSVTLIESDFLEKRVRYSLTYLESFARLSPDGSYWKTPLCLLDSGSTLLLEAWPKSGMMRNGECYLRPPLEHPICEKGSGGYLDCIPTPVARSSFYERNQSQMNRNSPGYGVLLGGRPNPDWIEWLMGWPIGWTALKPLEMDKSLAVWRRLFCNYHLDSLERGPDDTSTFDLDDVSRDINAREYGKTARKRRESDMKQRTLFE